MDLRAKQLRLAKGLTLQQVHDLTGLEPGRVNRLERGLNSSRDYFMLTKLADCYGVTIDELLAPAPQEAAKS